MDTGFPYTTLFVFFRAMFAPQSILSNNKLLFVCPQVRSKDQIYSYKRIVTMLYIISLFLACFIPFISIMVIKMLQGGGPRLNIMYKFSVTIVYLHSSLNPFVYCFRLREIRIAVFKLLGRKYTIDLNGDLVPVSRLCSNHKIVQLKNSKKNLCVDRSKLLRETYL